MSFIIEGNGKFQGEPYYIPLFYEVGLEGYADEDNGDEYIFYITEDDNSRFPELPIGSKLIITERSDGFVCSKLQV